MAVKCIEIHRLSPKSKENLVTEIKLMKQFDHKHIVKLKDFYVRELEFFPSKCNPFVHICDALVYAYCM